MRFTHQNTVLECSRTGLRNESLDVAQVDEAMVADAVMPWGRTAARSAGTTPTRQSERYVEALRDIIERAR